jgi:RNA polymerase sigma-70 factor (ECF subfamily)
VSETEFETAYRELAPRALTIATRVLRDRAAAEDVVQDVFIELWRRPQSYDASRGTLSAYVSMLARCRALDRMRAVAARDSADDRAARRDLVGMAAPETAADPVLRRERTSEAMAALRAVPAPQREAVLLSYGLGLSTSELAAARGLPLGTAKSRMRLGLRKARAAAGAVA